MTDSKKANHEYRGRRAADGCVCVTVDGEPLPMRLDLLSHASNGFEWGYDGYWPAQLAVAILAHHFSTESFGSDRAVALHKMFKRLVIIDLPETEWALTSEDVDATVKRIMEGGLS